MKSQKVLNLQHPLLQQAISLYQAGKPGAALTIYKELLTSFPNDATLLSTMGKVALQVNQIAESVEYNQRAVELDANLVSNWFYLGIGLKQLKRYAEALAAFERTLKLNSVFAEAYCNRGSVLQDMLRGAAALQSFEQAIAIRPDYALAYFNRGITLKYLHRFTDALASYDRAIALKADFAEAWCYRGNVLLDMQRLDEAMRSYAKALSLKPNYADAWYQQGLALYKQQNYPAALSSFERALALNPAIAFLPGQILFTRAQICDWQNIDSAMSALAAQIMAGENACFPFASHAFFDSPALQLQAATSWTQAKCPANPALPAITPYSGHPKIRVGYFSADFRQHPVAFLTAELFELHDREDFQIFGFSYAAASSGDEMRLRLERGFDRFIDISDLSDQQAVELIRDMEIDIAVDLGGHTRNSRMSLFAMRVAPLQLSYIGFLGTLATGYMDYLLADAVLIPAESQPFYTEKLIYLPSYQVNDSQRQIANIHFSRQQLGLPESGFVFCCFNNNFKITAETFSGWMRILQSVQGSVLLLYAENDLVKHNLGQAALAHGIAPDRLIFSQRLPLAEHLARYRTADLFLDTLPYNAGATASDALWAGLPVLTRAGASFAGRLAASLLTAIDLPELITHNQADYEARAIELALNPEKMMTIKSKLAANRLSKPLFDTPLFTRNLEAAYSRIYARHQAGLPAEHITLPD
jgi:predicted O-linked N-acetylglucosamine transferase (SPINDLY family)